jgi:hypothetical protein
VSLCPRRNSFINFILTDAFQKNSSPSGAFETFIRPGEELSNTVDSSYCSEKLQERLNFSQVLPVCLLKDQNFVPTSRGGVHWPWNHRSIHKTNTFEVLVKYAI